MHMNSVPQHLLSEDRQEFERVLDEALRSAPHRPELAAVGQRLNTEQLRTMALGATAIITAAAAAEYQHYVKVREELRRPSAPADPSVRESGPASAEQSAGAVGLTGGMGEVAEAAGAGVVAVVAVLAPVLAGTAAGIFLLVGYVLRMLDPDAAFARTMLTTGWVFGAVTAVAILVAAIGLLLTALRNKPSALGGPYPEADEELSRAREAWREALLERGIVPFLRDALADPETAALHRTTAPSAPVSRIPNLGYARPGFSSPEGGSTRASRPSYSSPDYTSPDFGGPEHQPD
ncbi:membrane protein [Streptomyces thermocarboxydovorans]|uniref:Membrane protein n=1 Tax=Streptomyces thermocarboxydovorans TaxID=59298 RepID=A0ABP3ST77_9ACTN